MDNEAREVRNTEGITVEKEGSGPKDRRPTPHTEPHTEPEATPPVHTFSKVYTGEVEQPLHKSKHKSARPGPGGRFSGNMKTYTPMAEGRFSADQKTYSPAPGGRFSGNPPSSDDSSVGHSGLIAASHGGQGPESAGASPVGHPVLIAASHGLAGHWIGWDRRYAK